MIYNLRICQGSILTYWKMVIKNQSCWGIFSLKSSLQSHQAVMTSISPSPSRGHSKEVLAANDQDTKWHLWGVILSPKTQQVWCSSSGWVGGWALGSVHKMKLLTLALFVLGGWCLLISTQERPLATGFFELVLNSRSLWIKPDFWYGSVLPQ